MQEDILIKNLKNVATQETAFSELVSNYKERLYWHIRRIVLDHDDTDDVLQNTFIKVFQNINSFKEESAVYTWLYRIATNEALSFLKKKATIFNTSSEELQSFLVENLKADVYFDGDEIQLKLQQAIASLPEKQRLVFNMKYYEEMKYEDISKILDTSVGGLKASYHHAVKKIEAFLKD
ncbi:RNA polymerase sigma factor [Galbibacter orientalis]|uniref:RNA polymerase sigma factor n=1 Tax=Galbibacter orientalis DSM 19592 TaxID=926559 RepID=I3C0S4_9FLAO|nr:RNA polymerase sigma factor [Galbibacter orientalis]EIJ37217.1 RNA polymerase sigma factor, sigma-70 family [Galbibacter orientalis DSM 19592]